MSASAPHKSPSPPCPCLMTHFCVSLSILLQKDTCSKSHIIKGHIYIYSIPTQRHAHRTCQVISAERCTIQKKVVPQLQERVNRQMGLSATLVRKQGEQLQRSRCEATGCRGATTETRCCDVMAWPAVFCVMDLQV